MTKNEKLEELIAGLYPDLKGIHKERFMHIVKETRLDPLRNQIYAVSRNSRTPDGRWEKTFTTQTSIDGFRLIAERTEKYAPGKEPTWHYDEDGRLESATAYVKKMTKDGTWHEVGATAYLDEYAQRDKKGNLTRFWQKMGRLMISKCAEALALRKAFPDALSGVYTDDEMLQANEQTDQNDCQNDCQIDSQTDRENKKKIPSNEEINSLMSLLNKVPGYRTILEKFLSKQGYNSFSDIPYEIYDKMIKEAKNQVDENKPSKPVAVRSKRRGLAHARS